MIIAFMIRSPISLLSVVVLWAVWPADAVFAFNGTAHRVVGHIAAEQVCRATRKAVRKLDPGRSIAEAGLWADEIRSQDYWDALKPWHYMNVPDGVPLAEARRSRRGDVLLGIEKFRAELADPATDELDRRVAYRLLVHFVADIHQPLHVGRREDAGGNNIRVRVDGRRTNLHAYWDGYDLTARVADPRAYARELIARYAGQEPQPGGGAADWAQESIMLREQAYAVPPGSVPELSDAYRRNYIEIIDLRLYAAGVRLAAMLDGIYCPAK